MPSTTSLAALAIAAAVWAAPASAECKRYGFLVNDYGKEGPTRDAKELLDKHIATKMAERGIKTYTTGKKDVSCELFLNFIVFDEHTCTAEATVCWGGSVPQGGVDQTAGAGADKAKATKAAGTTPAKTEASIETGSTDKTQAAAPAEPQLLRRRKRHPAAAEPAPAAKEAAPEGAAQ